MKKRENNPVGKYVRAWQLDLDVDQKNESRVEFLVKISQHRNRIGGFGRINSYDYEVEFTDGTKTTLNEKYIVDEDLTEHTDPQKLQELVNHFTKAGKKLKFEDYE